MPGCAQPRTARAPRRQALLAKSMAAAHADQTSATLLALLTSAIPNVNADWGAAASAPPPAPGLVMLAAADPYGDKKPLGRDRPPPRSTDGPVRQPRPLMDGRRPGLVAEPSRASGPRFRETGNGEARGAALVQMRSPESRS